MSSENVKNISGFALYSNAIARAADIICIMLAGYMAYYFRFGFNSDVAERYQWMMLSGMLLVSMTFSASGVYRSWRGAVRVDLVALLSRCFLLVTAIIVAYLFFSKTGDRFSRLWLFHWLVASFLLCVISRVIAYPLLNKLRKSGKNRKHVMLVGSSHSCRNVISRLNKVPSAGLDVIYVRCLDDFTHDSSSVICDEFEPERDVELVVDEIWICLPLSRGEQVERIIDCFKGSTSNIRYMPDLYEFLLLNHNVSTVAGMYMLDISCSPMSGTSRIVKELEDRVFSLFCIILLSPVMLVLALMVRLTSRGPVIYRQERMSWNGKPFFMYKFRSMPFENESGGAVWGQAGKKMVTPIGRFLRATNLDELPQLFNVLRGDMSLVGPRPERSKFVEQFKHQIPGYMQKHMVKAGMTGWAQVHGYKGDTSLEKRIELDLWYIENWSFWLDMKIFFLTCTRFVKIRGV